jgi:hypothetical protein
LFYPWYSGSANHVEQFNTADNQLLLDIQVGVPVQPMGVAPVLTVNWQ